MGNYGIFLIIGNAGFISSTVVQNSWAPVECLRHSFGDEDPTALQHKILRRRHHPAP